MRKNAVTLLTLVVAFILFFGAGCGDDSSPEIVPAPAKTRRKHKKSTSQLKNPSFGSKSKTDSGTPGKTPQGGQGGKSPAIPGGIPPSSDTAPNSKGIAPTERELVIWNNILAALKKLIVAKQVQFSPLGTSYTSLKPAPEDRYYVLGRCVITEKNGKKMQYEFECEAVASQYSAYIITTNFRPLDQ